MIYPSNPTVGEIINVGGTKKKWDGIKWVNVTHGNHELRLQFAEKSAALMTLAEAQECNLKVGRYVRLTDFANALYKVVPAAETTGYLIEGLTSGHKLQYIPNGVAYFDHFDFANDPATDDSAKFVRMLEHSGAVYFEGASGYNMLVNTPFTVPAKHTINLKGGTVNTDLLVGTFVTVAEEGSLIHGYIKGKATTYIADHIGVKHAGTYNVGLPPSYIKGGSLSGLRVSGFGSHGAFIQYVDSGMYNRMHSEDNYYTGIGVLSCNDVIIDKPVVKRITVGSAGGDAYGIFMDRLEIGSEVENPRSYRCKVTNPMIDGVNANGGNGQGLDTHAGVDIEFINPQVRNVQVGFALTSSTISGVPALASKRCKVVGGSFDAGTTPTNQVGYGGLISGAWNGSGFVEYAEDPKVVDVTFVGFGSPGDSLSGCIFTQGTKRMKLSTITSLRPHVASVNLGIGNINFTIEDLTSVDPFDNTYSSPSGVLVSGSDNRGSISGTFVNENNTLGTYVAVNSVRINSGLTGLDIKLKPSEFNAVDSTKLQLLDLTTGGLNKSGFDNREGTATISVANGGANGILDVTFDEPMVYSPKISIQLVNPVVGGKVAVAYVDNAVVPTRTGFRVYVYPADLTTFTANGTANITWRTV